MTVDSDPSQRHLNIGQGCPQKKLWRETRRLTEMGRWEPHTCINHVLSRGMSPPTCLKSTSQSP